MVEEEVEDGEYEILPPHRVGGGRARAETFPDKPARKRVQSSPARIQNKKTKSVAKKTQKPKKTVGGKKSRR